MAAGLKAGVAFVELDPKIGRGFEAAVTKELNGPLSRVGSKLSAAGGAMTKAITLPIIAGVAALGAGIYMAGKKLDDAMDNIAIKTGKTGKPLEALQQSFRNVAARVPNDMQQVSDAIAELHARTGATGPGLEGLATKILTLSRITKSDLSTTIEQSTRLFGDWSIAADDQGDALDRLFTLSQNTGVGMDFLSERLVQFGGPLRQLGFGLDESAAILAKFQKEGVNTELVMGSMRIALGKMSKAGEKPAETLRRVMEEIKGAGDAGTANAKALELFGARAGPDMAAAIREGRFEIGGLLDTLGNSEGSIDKAAKKTDGFAETFGRLKNNVILAVEPLATKLFAALDSLIPKLIPVTQWIGRAIDYLVNLDPKWQLLIAGIIGAVAAAGPLVSIVGAIISALPILGGILAVITSPIVLLAAAFVVAYLKVDAFREIVDNAISWLVTNVPPMVARVISYLEGQFDHLLGWVRKVWPSIQEAIGHVLVVVQKAVELFIGYVKFVWDAWGDDLLHIVEAAFGYVKRTIENVLTIVRGVIQVVTSLINGDWGKAWDGVKQILGAVWDQIKNIISSSLTVVKAVIGGALSGISAAWSFIWEQVKNLAKMGWQAMVDWLKGGGLGNLLTFFIGLPGQIFGVLGSLVSRMLQFGKDLIEGMKNGVVSMAKSLLNSVKDVVTAPVDWAKDFLGIGSPSKLFTQYGKWTVQGFINGLISEKGRLGSTVQEVIGGAIASVRTMLGAIGAANNVQAAQRTLRDARQNVLDIRDDRVTITKKIGAQELLVAKLTKDAADVTVDEHLRILKAKQDVEQKTADLAKMEADGLQSTTDYAIARDELVIAERDLAAAKAESTGPTQELMQAESDLKDLRDALVASSRSLRDANDQVEDAERGVIEAQVGLLEASQSLIGLSPAFIAFFRAIAREAGLSEAAIDSMLRRIDEAAHAAQATNTAVEQGTQGTPGALRDTHNPNSTPSGSVKQELRNIAAFVGETWTPGKIDRIAQQIAQGDRTIDSVVADVGRRITGHAMGGTFRGLGIVGEKGPELIHSASLSRVRTNSELASMIEAAGGAGTSKTYELNLHGPFGNDEVDVEEQFRRMELLST